VLGGGHFQSSKSDQDGFTAPSSMTRRVRFLGELFAWLYTKRGGELPKEE
jgi:hypothetical protein